MGDEGKGTKKKGRLKKWILGIGGFLVFLMIVSSCGDDSESESVDVESEGASEVGEPQEQETSEEKNTETEEVVEEGSTTDKNEESSAKEEVENYKNKCQTATFQYNNLLRYEDQYKGHSYKFTAEVLQLMDGGKTLRVSYEEPNDESFNTNEVVIFDSRTYDTVKILQDDTITVYADYVGGQEFTRTINDTKVTVPCFRMYAADISGVTDTEFYGKDMENIDYVEIYGDVLASDVGAAMDGFSHYCLYDLNKDGRKEMLICTGQSEADAKTNVYTVDEIGGVSYIGEYWGNLMYYQAEDGDGLYGVYGHMGCETVYRIYMPDNKVFCTELWSKEVGASGYYENENYVPYVDGNDTSLLEQG